MGVFLLTHHPIKLLGLSFKPLVKGFLRVGAGLEDKDLGGVPVLDSELAQEGIDTVFDRHLVNNHNTEVGGDGWFTTLLVATFVLASGLRHYIR